MNLVSLAARNALRNKTRSALTVFAASIAVLTFILLRTVLSSWSVAVDYAAKDRIATRDRISFFMPLPRSYADVVRNTPKVAAATFATWFGGKDARDPDNSFATLAVDPASYLDVYDEISLPAEARQRWLGDRRGAVVGDLLAQRLKVKVGDTINLAGTIYPGDWQFVIDGIYKTDRTSADRSWFLFHWDYLNEAVEPRQRDQIGWTVARVSDPNEGAAISAAVDSAFEDHDVQTTTMSERSMQMSFLTGASAILTTLNLVSLTILALMALILANTIAMGVRERTSEYGALRAIGFLPRHIVLFVAGESVAIGVLGGVIGLGLSFPLVERGLGRFIEENMGGIFPYFRIAPSTSVMAVVCSGLVAALAAAVPAYRASRLSVTDALRRVG